MNFEEILSPYRSKACIMSVETLPNGDYGNIRIAAGNAAHCADMLQSIGRPFVPDSPYGDYFPQNKNFEDSCYRAAVLGETLHSYVRLPQMDLWLYMTLLPLCSDRENVGYCLYSYEVTPFANPEQRTSLSADMASAVLRTCLKLRDGGEFEEKLRAVTEDIRKFCDSDSCGILLADQQARRCTLLCESRRPGCQLELIRDHADPETFVRTKSWDETIGDSSCLVVKDQKDLNWLARENPGWHRELTEAGGRSVVMFPLNYNGNPLGHIWVVNFDTNNAVKIKETLELTTFFIASEVSNFQLLQKLEELSAVDMLTGVKNRNSMNNLISDITESRVCLKSPCQVIFADLNGLKRVNDEQGHDAGDQLLKTAAAVLRAVFPETDVFRAGGDEFMLLAPGMTKEELEARINRLRAMAEKAEDLHFAVGTASLRESDDIRMALHVADQMMYIDKNDYYERHPERRYR